MTSYRNRYRTQADIDLGVLIARARVDAELTQVELAEAMTAYTGVPWSQVTISNLERGRTPCTVGQLMQLSHLIGVSHARLGELTAAALVPVPDLPADDGQRPRVTP